MRLTTMRLTVTATGAVDPPAAWAQLTTVPGWQDWALGIIGSETDGPFEVGMRARIVQAGLRATVWTVDAIDEGRSFEWSSSGTGFAMTSVYTVAPAPRGCAVRFDTTITGPMGWAVMLIARRPLRRFQQAQATALATGITPSEASPVPPWKRAARLLHRHT